MTVPGRHYCSQCGQTFKTVQEYKDHLDLCDSMHEEMSRGNPKTPKRMGSDQNDGSQGVGSWDNAVDAEEDKNK